MPPVHGDAKGGVYDLLSGDQPVRHEFHPCGGDGKAQTLDVPVLRDHFDGGDADDLPPVVQQRSAGIAEVNGGAGLNQIHGHPVHLHIPVQAGDNALADGAGVAHGVPHGGDSVPGPQQLGVPEPGGGEVFRVDFQHSQILCEVVAHQLGGVRVVVPKLDLDLQAALDHVGVGEDIPVLGQDYPGAAAVAAPASGLDGHDGGPDLGVKLRPVLGPALLGEQGQGHAGAGLRLGQVRFHKFLHLPLYGGGGFFIRDLERKPPGKLAVRGHIAN